MGKIADISHHQGDIIWSKASQDLDLAVIRVQYGSTTIDRKLKQNIEGCKNYNVPFAHYAYALYLNVADAEKEANDFLSRIDNDAKFLVVDVEEITVRDIKDLIPATQRFIDICQNAGHKVGLYSGEYFFKYYGLSQINCDFLWVAKYSDNKPSVAHDIWQHTSSGSVAGIAGRVDLNVISGSKSLEYFTSKQQPVPTPQAQKPLMVVKAIGASDIRAEPSHTSGFIRNTVDGEVFNVWEIQNDWHRVAAFPEKNIFGWIDGNNGSNLSWLDNPALTQEPVSNPTQSQAIYYIVKSGDTVSKLASKFGSSLAQIKAWNGLDSKYTIYAGKKIRVK